MTVEFLRSMFYCKLLRLKNLEVLDIQPIIREPEVSRSTAAHISPLNGALAKVVGDVDDETSLGPPDVPHLTLEGRSLASPAPLLEGRLCAVRNQDLPFLLLDVFSPQHMRDMISALLAFRNNWNPLLQPTSGRERTA